MSFPKAPLKRFNEALTCAPPPGSYDIPPSDPSKGHVSFDRSQRFSVQTGDAEGQQNPNGTKPPSPPTGRKFQSLGPRSNSFGTKSKEDQAIVRGLRKQKELEKEIRALIGERGQQDKKLQSLEKDLAKSESKLSAVIREKTSLSANVASLEKQLLELSKTNELLKTKCFEDGPQMMSSLYAELMKLRKQMNAKKVALIKKENMHSKPNTVPRTLDHSKEKVPQLEEQLIATEVHAEEKCDSENLLEYIAELGIVAEQVEDKYKQEVAQLEEIIEAKNKDIETLQTTLEQKESMLSTQFEELWENCQFCKQQKEKCCIEYGEKKQTLNAEIKSLKEKLNLEEQEHQKQKEAWKEAFASEHQKLLEFQEEMTEEREILRRDLKETMDELERLQTKESKVDELLKRLEQENVSQAEQLAWLEEKLKGKSAELEKMAELHSSDIVKMQGEHSITQCKLKEITAEFETYKVCVGEEIACLRREKTALQDKLLEMSKTTEHMTEVMQGVQQAKEKAKEDWARMLLDAEAKIALKNEEIQRIKDSSAVQVANLQAKLEEQSKYLTKQLEMERKTIAEKVESDYREQIETWHVLYEELYNKVKPFQKQLDAYEAEKNALLNEQGVAQEELNKISDAYAKLLGHQNQKQKIKHVMKLKEENTQLKQEVSRLRAQIAKEKKARGDLQDQMNAIQGIKRFDPSKAFQHSTKENVAPKTPFKESNRNKSQTGLDRLGIYSDVEV